MSDAYDESDNEQNCDVPITNGGDVNTQPQLQDLGTDLVHTAGDIADSADGSDFRSTATYGGQRLRRSNAVMPVRNQQLDGTGHGEQESMEREVWKKLE